MEGKGLQPASEVAESKLCCLMLHPRQGQASLVTKDMATHVMPLPQSRCPSWRGFPRGRGWGVAVPVLPCYQSLLEKHLLFPSSNWQYSPPHTCTTGSATSVSLLLAVFILAHVPCVF